MNVRMEAVYIPSFDIVARDIDGELIIVPLAAGIGDLEDEFFSLNETGSEVWRQVDGKHSLAEIVAKLAQDYDTSKDDIQKDVQGLVEELLQRGILVEAR